MIPERLEVEAFGPFVAKQTLDFERAGAQGLFLIHGPTGSGKSTILDAMTFALFGETSGNDRDGADLVSILADGAESRVTFTFRHGGARYRVTRTPRQLRRMVRRDGVREVQPTATLYRLGGESEHVLDDKATSVTRRVCELLHCDARQFRQTVVLPQGQFRRVVEDDETRERALAELFGTARFEDAQNRLKAYAKHLRGSVRALLDERSALGEEHGVTTAADLERCVAEAKERADTARDAAAQAEAALTASIEALTRAETVVERFGELERARSTLDRLEAERSVIAGERERLEADRRAQLVAPAVAALTDTSAALAERMGAREAASEAALEANSNRLAADAALAELEARADEITKRRTDVARLEALEPLVARFEDMTSKAEVATGVADALREQVEGLEAQRAELGDRKEDHRRALESLAVVLADEGAVTAASARAQQRLKAFTSLTHAREALAAAAGGSAAADLDALWDPLMRSAAARLAPGEPCPVCGSTEHRGAMAAQDHAAALDEVQEILRTAQEAAIGAAAERVRQEERLQRALEEGGWEAGALPSSEELEHEVAAATERAVALADARTEHQERTREVGALDLRAREVEEELEGARTARSSADTAATQATTLLAEARERLGSDFDGAEAFHATLDGVRAAVAAYEEDQRKRSDQAREAATAAEVSTDRLARATGELERAEARRGRAEDEAHAALREHGFVAVDGSASREAYERARLDAEARASAAQRVGEHDTSLAATTARARELESLLADQQLPDLDALEAIRAAREGERNEAFEARTTAKRARDELVTAAKRWRELERELGDRETRERTASHLSDLVNGTATGQLRLDLRTYVLKRIMRTVLAHANVHLARMTAGRYQLRLRESSDELRAHGLGLDVEDRHAGGARRRVATLSGGEGFQASLALALGLSETAQRTSGAVELGALFIDEGFGSLDALALDEVVKILRELPSVEGRMVGVITHVEDLKRRIDAQVLVTRDEIGSRLTVSGAA